MKKWNEEMNEFDRAMWIETTIVISMLLAGLAAFCLLFFGCNTYTVVPADYHAVPVRQTGEDTYARDVDDATGWYVPDALMLKLLEAE